MQDKDEAGANVQRAYDKTWSRSFLFRGISTRIHLIPVPENFWVMDKFFGVVLVFFIMLLLNDIAVLFFLIHVAIILALTFFSTSPLPDLNPPIPAPGEAVARQPTIIERLSGLLIILNLAVQGILSPILMLLEPLYVFFPMYFIKLQFPSSAVGYIPRISIQRRGGHIMEQLVRQLIWVVIVCASFELVHHYITLRNRRFRPLRFYWMVYETIMDTLRGRGNAVKQYLEGLGWTTRICKKISLRFWIIGRLIGELGLIVIVLLWAGWPNLVPVYFEAHLWLFLTIPLTCLLLFKSRKTIKENWEA
eukprot:TRINITY_DN24301_c0_g3_i1.p1 TRINITY_DN24301_c0_g3~~TRINITY_DN24301_c0_g3_i1.p1  ORF type:complete len:354 (-),score=62.30 TRINITY_DN24301_c0_g3_i1:15-932(-)